MFRCDGCKLLSVPGEKPVRVVVARRSPVRYPETGRLNGTAPFIAQHRDGSPRAVGRPGWEIAHEAVVHRGCAPAPAAPAQPAQPAPRPIPFRTGGFAARRAVA